MAEPASTSVVIATAAGGVTIFGIATGLHLPLLVAGMAGGWWALSLRDPMPLKRRITAIVIASLTAAWGAPVAGGVLSSFSWWPAHAMAAEILQLPIAVVFGRLAHTVFGASLDDLVKRKMEGA